MMKLLLAATAAVLASLSASAQDIARSPYDWSGAYLGLYGAYADGDTNHSTFDNRGGFGETGDLSINGLLAGITLGRNWKVDRTVFGLEADLGFSTISGAHAGAFNTFRCTGTDAYCETEVNWLATFRGRAGFAIDRFLPYITGGLAIGGVDAQLPPSTNLAGNPTTKVGWTVGFGADLALTEKLIGKVEYLYTDLGRWNYGYENGDFFATAKFSTIKLGLNYKF